MGKFGVTALLLFVLSGIGGIGCSDSSQNPQVLTGSLGNDLANAAAVNISQSELTLLRLAGIRVDDGGGVFSIGWRQLFDPRRQTDSTVGRAMAVGFDSSRTAVNRGIDMGTVFLNYAANHIELQKRAAPDGRIIYTSSLGPREGSTNVQFVPNGTYQFEVTGSAGFSAMNADISAPAALLDITGPAQRDSISSTHDLTVTWQGGNLNSGVLVAIAALPPAVRPPQGGFGDRGPSGPPPQGPGPMGGGEMGPPPGGDHPMLDSSRAIIVRLDNNPGTYTVSASALQALISATNAGGLMCTVSQMNVHDVAHDGSTVHIVFRNGDGVMVKVN